MHKNPDLHSFLLERAKLLTEEWYNSLDKSDPKGVYSSTNPEAIKRLKGQNYDFHLHLCQVFIEDESTFSQNFTKWIVSVARDENHLQTPIHFVIREFMRVRNQYMGYVKDFVAINSGKYDINDSDQWCHMIMKAFDHVIQRFVEESYEASVTIIKAQEAAYRETLLELSSPIIPIADRVGVLPIIGEIDTHRARIINQSCLKKGYDLQLEHLVIDLSGVPFVDQEVANELFQLIEGLSMLGINTMLTGIRPVIAQISISIGLDFKNIKTYATLKQALVEINNR